MYKDSYNDYIRSVLGNDNSSKDDNNIRYPEEDKSYYCDYSHPKNDMQKFDMQNYNMQNYDIMYSDYQNRYGMPDYYEYGYYPNGYNSYDTRSNSEIEECYPEIYGIVYPMVQKACRNITQPVTKADVEKMVEELYNNLEGTEEVNLNITLNNNVENSNRNQVGQSKIEERQEINTMQRPVRQPNRSTGLFKPNVEPKRDVPLKPRVEEKRDVINNNVNSKILEQAKETPKEPRYCNNGLCDIIRILLVRELLWGSNRPGPRPPFPPFRPGPGPRPPFNPGPRPPFYR